MFVELKDADSGKIYSLEMSLEEWNKCDNDLLYAQELLEKCKREKSTENNLTNILDQDLDGSACGSERHTWTYDEIIKLIAAVESHNDELLAVNPRIKKKGWENIINDLLSLGIIVTVAEAKKKWANLIQTYNKVKDNKRKTGRGPTKFNFFEKIDSIIGNKPSNCSPHSLNIGTLSKSTSASQKEIEKPLNEEASSSNTSTIENEASTSSTSATENEEGDVNKQESTPNCTPKAAKAFRNRKTPNQEYQNSKLRYLKRKEEHLEKMELLKKKREEKKEEREQERQMILKKRLQLEERKILAVENYLALKKEEMKNEPKI